MNNNNRVFGLARVSSKDQNEIRQIKALRDFGILEKNIYVDKQSGKDFNREQYQLLKKTVKRK